jgi:hypothetical protein
MEIANTGTDIAYWFFVDKVNEAGRPMRPEKSWLRLSAHSGLLLPGEVGGDMHRHISLIPTHTHSFILILAPSHSFSLILTPFHSSLLHNPSHSFSLLLTLSHFFSLLHNPSLSFSLFLSPPPSFSLLLTNPHSFSLLLPYSHFISLLPTHNLRSARWRSPPRLTLRPRAC